MTVAAETIEGGKLFKGGIKLFADLRQINSVAAQNYISIFMTKTHVAKPLKESRVFCGLRLFSPGLNEKENDTSKLLERDRIWT